MSANYNFKKWKLGLLIACVCGVLNAGAGLLGDMNWKSFLAVLCASLLTNLLTYLKQHPIEDISDTAFSEKPGSQKPEARINLWFFILCGSVALWLTAGCASFTTKQTDTSYENGKPVRSITTQAKARTIADSKSQLANFKASQTDKTQGASVGALSQESSGTNAVQVLNALKGIVDSLPK